MQIKIYKIKTEYIRIKDSMQIKVISQIIKARVHITSNNVIYLEWFIYTAVKNTMNRSLFINKQ